MTAAMNTLDTEGRIHPSHRFAAGDGKYHSVEDSLNLSQSAIGSSLHEQALIPLHQRAYGPEHTEELRPIYTVLALFLQRLE